MISLARTKRRQPWGWQWDQPGRWLKNKREKTCRPGCVVCGKPFNKLENRKERHTWAQHEPDLEG